jgi:hypothetical protein
LLAIKVQARYNDGISILIKSMSCYFLGNP